MNVLAAAGAAAWLGLMTSISPCPLATNIAAVSFLARRLDSQRRAVLSVIAYALGRAAAYAAVGLLVAWGLAAAPELSRILQRVLEPFIGPLLILVGLVLLGWIPVATEFRSRPTRCNRRPGRVGTARRVPTRGPVRGDVLPDFSSVVLRQPPPARGDLANPVAAFRNLWPCDRRAGGDGGARGSGGRKFRGEVRRWLAALAGVASNVQRLAHHRDRRVPHAAGSLRLF